MAARREAGEPLQYVFGHWPFRHLDLLVDRRVLIPRPETEQVVEVALGEGRRLRHLADPAPGEDSGGDLVVVDAGTGSGAIALALASELGPGLLREVWATDVSADALEVAAVNVEARRASGGGQPLPRIELAEGSWLEALPARLRGAVDLLVANPPYVSAGNGPAWRPRSAPSRAGPSWPGPPATARPGWPTWRRCWRSAGSGWGGRAAPSWSWHPTRPSPRGARPSSRLRRSSSRARPRGSARALVVRAGD